MIIKKIIIKYSLALTLFIVFFGASTLKAQNSAEVSPEALKYTNHIFKPGIKTVQLHKPGWPLSYPIITLNSGGKLQLSFDELADEPVDYYYTFLHCDSDWQASGLMETEYLEGFAENQFNDYAYSFNTTIKYLHYKLQIPNEDVGFRISGNYILLVYANYNKEEPVLTRRFMVTEEMVQVNAIFKRPAQSKYYESHQEIEVAVRHPMYEIANPYGDVKLVIAQNGRWDNASKITKPSFLRNREIVYDFDPGNVFPGGNEYRYFDIKSMRYQTEYVQFSDYVDSMYFVALVPSRPKYSMAYFQEMDNNGKYYIKKQEGTDADTDADYARVYFTLNTTHPETSGDVYVFGGLSDWSMGSENRMIFNYETGSYETSLLLKQGYYNYAYVWRKDSDVPTGDMPGSVYADHSHFDGSHFETENDYLIYIYHMAPGSRYDRLVGSAIINTRNR